MSWVLFIDESGQDRHESPYEVLAGLAVEDRQIWRLIRQLSDAQLNIFGTRLFKAYGSEAKAQKLLKRKVFAHAAQMDPLEPALRRQRAREILADGTQVTRERLTALGQAKLEYCDFALRLCLSHGAKAFASIVPRGAQRPATHLLRKDYAYLFERFFYFLNSQEGDPMGFLVFDEIEKARARSCSIRSANILFARATAALGRVSSSPSRFSSTAI